MAVVVAVMTIVISREVVCVYLVMHRHDIYLSLSLSSQNYL